MSGAIILCGFMLTFGLLSVSFALSEIAKAIKKARP